tara:strand:+ start:1496 stop:1696 length:201 start_codon:yes stop_codon:yes gene_type:complete
MSHLKERQEELIKEIQTVAEQYNKINGEQNQRLDFIKNRQGALEEVKRQLADQEKESSTETEVISE